MSTAAVRGVVRQLGLADADPESDAALVTRYARRGDHAAFAELLRRHGPVVLGACRRVLNDSHAAEDAFQATFLVLAVKASCVRPPGAVGGWLYGVAVNVARKAKVAAARRWRREMATVMASPGRESGGSSCDHTDLRAVIDEELARLPSTLRDAVVQCDLNDRTRSEAAKELGWPEGTVAARLHKARKLLAERLTRRGVTLPAAGLATLIAPQAVSAALTQSTLAAASSFVANAASKLVSPAVRTLAEGMVRTMSTGKLKLAIAALAVGLLTGGGLLWGANPNTNPTPDASSEAVVSPTEPAQPKPDALQPYVHAVAYSPDGKRFAVSPGVSVRDPSGKVLYTVPGEAAGFSPDGKTLIVMGAKSITVHDAETGKKLKLHEAASDKDEYSHPRPKTNLGWHQVTFSPDGKRYAAHFGFNVRVYDTATGFEPTRLEDQHEPGSTSLPVTVGKEVTFSPDGKRLAAVGVLVGVGKLGAAVWDAETGKRLYSVEGDFTDGPKSIAFSPDGKQVAVGFAHKAVLYDAATLKEVRQVQTLGTVSVVAFTPNGLVALGGEAKLSDGKQPPADRRRIVVHIDDARKPFGSTAVLDYGNEVGKTTLPLTAMAFSPDAKVLVMGTGYPNVTPLPDDAPKLGGAVRVFPLDGSCGGAAAIDGWQQVKAFADHDDYVDSVAVGPDGQTFATAGGGTVIMWDADTRKHLWTFKVENPGVTAVAYSSNGLQLAVTHKDGVTLLNAASGKVDRQVEERDANPSAVAFAPEGEQKELKPRRLAFTNGRVVWAKSWVPNDGPIGGAQFGPLAGGGGVNPTYFPAAVAYSPDGQRLVFIPNEKIDPVWVTTTKSGDFDPKKATHYFAQVWGGGSGKPMGFYVLGTDPVTAVAWSPDGKTVALGSSTGDVALFDADTAKELRRTHVGGRNGRSAIHALTFSPDCKVLAAALAFEDGKNVNRVVLFDAKTLDRGQDLQQFRSPPVSVAFTPDGRTLVVGCGHKDPFYRDKPAKERVGEVQLWSLDAGR